MRMSKTFQKLLEDNHELVVSLVSSKETLKQVCEALGYSNNGRYTGAISRYLNSKNVDFSHFRLSRSYPKDIIECVCPQCGCTFTKNLNNAKDRDKVTCSHACANKYFSDKQQYGRHLGEGFNKAPKYTLILDKFLATHSISKECVVCAEVEVLDCHHIDGDRSNNDVTNLVYLCPNHHNALHRNNSQLVFDAIVKHLDYRDMLNN